MKRNEFFKMCRLKACEMNGPFAHFAHFLFELIFRNCDVFGMMFMFFFIATFAPMNGGTASELPDANSWKQPFDAQRYFSHSESD